MESAGIRSQQAPDSASSPALPSSAQSGRGLDQSANDVLPGQGRGEHDTDGDREARLKVLTEKLAAFESHRAGPTPHDLGAGGTERNERQKAGGEPGEQAAAARAICLRLLAVAPRPRAGLAQALQRKEIPDDVANAVLDRLTEVGLIDDVAYAQSFVRTKHRDRALGRTALRTELRRLGVDEESMASAVDTVDSDAERTRAAALIAKRLDAAMAAGAVAARRRLLGLLGRRGYPPDIAIQVVDSAIQGYAGSGGDYSDGSDSWS